MFDPHQQKLFEQALTLHRAAKFDAAARIYGDLLVFFPDHADLLQLLGVLNFQRQNYDDAIALMQRSLARAPNQPSVHLNLGSALSATGRDAEALASYERAVALKADFAEAHFNRASILHKLGRLDEALASFQHTIRLKPDFADAHLNHGNLLKDLRRFADARDSYQRALTCNPNYVRAHGNLALVLDQMGHIDAAAASLRRAIAIDPAFADAYANLGHLLRRMRKYREALDAYRLALKHGADLPFLAGYHLHTKQHICDWSNIDREIENILTRVAQGQPAATPFTLLATSASPALLRKASEIYAERLHPSLAAVAPKAARPPDGKIRLGYFSADFHNHATAHLIMEMLERHDRGKFEITGFSWGMVEDTEMRTRLAAAFDAFIDIHTESDSTVAALARSLQIGIAVDLKGFTGDARPGVFARRCAPVQVGYLGFPGTMGCDYIDYLIADPVLIPPEQRAHYSERIVTLPDTYQANDTRRPIASSVPSRSALGLPDTGVVFCSFNGNFKITPAVFDVWMRLLRAVPGSVLWLLAGSPDAADNLRREAAARGVDGGRLVFAPRVTLADHLARHAHADVFLDTFHCNGHTTTSDALWAGVPVVTWAGETFAGRVSASLLCAAGLPELVAATWADYEAIALMLATDPAHRASLRDKLAAGRATCALFDAARFTRHIEAAYTRMWERAEAGHGPEDMAIGPS